MPIEKYSTIKPAPGQGKRVMKAKLLTALGATGVLRPYTANTERTIERKILLQNTFNPNPSSGGGPVGPCTSGTTFASAWSTQVVANGGAAPSAASQTAIANFQCGLITDGLDTQMIAWNAIASDNLTAALTPQLKGNGGVLWTNHNFVGGDLTATGLTGDGATKYVDCGDIVGALTVFGSIGILVYTPVVAASASGRSFGVLNLTILLMAAKDNTGNCLGGNGGSPSDIITTASQGAGFYSDQRINGADHRIFFANAANAYAQTGATDVNGFAGPLPGAAFYMHALNNAGAPFGFTAETIGFVGVTKGLVVSDGAKLFARVQTLMTAFGRQV